MIEFSFVLNQLKTVLQEQINRDKILDKDIAKFLELDPIYFAVIKRRNKIPYESLAYFCKRYKINMLWILFGKNPIYIE
jgi:hypothetical protein